MTNFNVPMRLVLVFFFKCETDPTLFVFKLVNLIMPVLVGNSPDNQHKLNPE